MNACNTVLNNNGKRVSELRRMVMDSSQGPITSLIVASVSGNVTESSFIAVAKTGLLL